MTILTIAIPAFQDAAALRGTLVSIIETLDSQVIGQVEILVSDNSSKDDTHKVACEILGGTSFGKVLRQAENIGFSRNLAALAHTARGEYIWFIGLGERVTQGTITSLVGYLESNSPDWGVLKGYFDFQDVARTVDQGFAEGNSSVYNSVPALNHVISLNVFRTEHAKGLKLERGFPANDFWPHFEIVAQLAGKPPTQELRWFYYDCTSVLIARNKHGAWDFKDLALDIFIEWGRVFARLARSIPKSGWILTRFHELRGRHFLEFVFMITKHGTVRRGDILRQVWQVEFLPLGTKVFATMVAVLPRVILRGLSRARGKLLAD